MTKGIVIDGARNVRIERNKFINLDTAVEAKNTTDLHLKDNEIIDKRIDKVKKED